MHLVDLQHSLLLKIADCLSIEDLQNFSETCKSFHEISKKSFDKIEDLVKNVTKSKEKREYIQNVLSLGKYARTFEIRTNHHLIINDADILRLAEGCPNLQQFCVIYGTHITKVSLFALASLKLLKSITIHYNQSIADKDLNPLLELPNLQKLDLQKNVRIFPEGENYKQFLAKGCQVISGGFLGYESGY